MIQLVYIFNDSSNELLLPEINVSEFKRRNSSLFTTPLQVPNGRNTDQVSTKEFFKKFTQDQTPIYKTTKTGKKRKVGDACC